MCGEAKAAMCGEASAYRMEDGLERRGWSLLPTDLLISIAEHLGTKDIGRLPAVCGGWAWALGRARKGWPPPPPTYRATFVPLENPGSPWMLLPNEDGDDAEYCDFLRLSESQGGVRVPRLRISPLPEMAGRICVGGSLDGWIVTLDMWLNPRILNPLTREEFLLPSIFTVFPYHHISPVYSPDGDGSISSFAFNNSGIRDIPFHDFRHKFVRKIILSSAPPLGIALLIHGLDCSDSYLSIAKVGDLAWSPGLDFSKNHHFHTIEDVVYHEKTRNFYVVTSTACVLVLNLDKYKWGSFKPPKATVLGTMRGRDVYSGTKYLVFSSAGYLLQVWREVDCFSERRELRRIGMGEDTVPYHSDDYIRPIIIVRVETIKMKVLKFDPGHYDGKNPASRWISVRDLGDEAIFLGCTPSVCVSTSDKPWLKRNCLYFTEDTTYGNMPTMKYYPRDGGIYDLKHKTIERFFPHNCKVNWPPPAWFMPARLKFIL